MLLTTVIPQKRRMDLICFLISSLYLKFITKYLFILNRLNKLFPIAIKTPNKVYLRVSSFVFTKINK